MFQARAVDETDPRRLVDSREQPLVLEAVRRPGELQELVAGAVQDGPLLLLGQVAVRRVEVKAGVPGNRLGERQERTPRPQRRPRPDRSLTQGQLAVPDDQRDVGPALNAQALAGRAPAEGAVEGVVVRVQHLVALAATAAREVLREALDLPLRLVAVGVHVGQPHHAAAERQGLLDGVGDAGPRAGLDDVAIDDHLDVVLAAVVDRRRLVQGERLAVHAHAGEPGLADLVEQRLVLLPALPLDRGQDVELRPLGQTQDALDDLVGRLRAHRLVALRAVTHPHAGVQDAQVVVDFGDRAHC